MTSEIIIDNVKSPATDVTSGVMSIWCEDMVTVGDYLINSVLTSDQDHPHVSSWSCLCIAGCDMMMVSVTGQYNWSCQLTGIVLNNKLFSPLYTDCPCVSTCSRSPEQCSTHRSDTRLCKLLCFYVSTVTVILPKNGPNDTVQAIKNDLLQNRGKLEHN